MFTIGALSQYKMFIIFEGICSIEKLYNIFIPTDARQSSVIAGPKRPTGRPPEGPDSDPIRIRAARELIKKIQIVTLNDDLGFYRPANWVNPTEKPTTP